MIPRSGIRAPRGRRLGSAGALHAARMWSGPRYGVALLLALALLTTAGCSDDSNDSNDESQSTTLTIGVDTGPGTLDPALDVYGTGSLMRYLSNEPILQTQPDGSFGPGLATEFGYVGDGNTTYEFTLRDDAKFSDGTPVTASAVKGWFEYVSKAGGPVSGYLPIKSIDTPDDRTVRINLSAPDPEVSFLMAGQNWGFVSSPKAVADPKLLTKGTYGAGPYMLDPKETVSGDHYTFVPNPFYYDKTKVQWSKIIVKAIESPTSRLQALESGQLDVAVGDLTTADAAEQANLNVSTADGGTASVLIFDRAGTLVPALGDVRVRQALNYAVDREAISDALVGKYGGPTSQFETLDGSDPSLDNYYPYDPSKAKSLLAEAGYPNGFTMSIVSPTYRGATGDPVVQAVAKNLEEVGVEVESVAKGTEADWAQTSLTGKYTATEAPFPVWQNFGTFYQGVFAGNGGFNPFGFEDPQLDDLINRANSAPEDEAASLFQDASKRVLEQAYMIPVFTKPDILLSSKDVTGATITKFWMVGPTWLQIAPN